MALNGLEKITGRIIADAEADAEATVREAEAKCAAINADYAEKARALEASYGEKTDTECQNVIIKARSSLDNAVNNIMLMKRAELIDSAFTEALRELCSLPSDKYAELLAASLTKALKDQRASERDSMALYGEDVSPEFYEVILSKHDRAEYGQKLIETVKAGASDGAVAEKLRLSDNSADIRGGLILKCGDVELNCSFEMILSEVRGELEPKVENALFHDVE